MSLKLDKFTWIVIGVMVAVLAGAVLTVNLTRGEGWGTPDYRAEDSPEAALYNAFVASIRQDNAALERYYTEKALTDESNKERLRPYGEPYYYRDETPRRLRILEVQMEDAETAMVTFAVDRYGSGGPFGSGSTYTNRQSIRVVRADGLWKLDVPQFNF